MNIINWLINHVVLGFLGSGLDWFGTWITGIVESGLSLDFLA